MSSPVTAYLKAQKRTLASVFPIDVRVDRRHNGYTTYVLPAAPKDGVSTLVVTGAIDFGIDRTTEPETILERPVPVDVVADDLLRTFSTGQLGATDAAGPGICICAGDKPTAEEIAAIRTRQTLYFTDLVYSADLMFARGESKGILQIHREAAKWLGVEGRPWVQELTPSSTKKCLACAETIQAQARVCKMCRTDLVEFAEKNGVSVEQDPFISAILQSRKPKKSA